MKVCEKVESKRTTTYNEVSPKTNEPNIYTIFYFRWLMNWWQNSNRQMQNQRKQIRYIYTIQGVAYGRCSPSTKKNIRRRVYDALNVLMAMGIISKEKKDIRWIGIPTSNKNTPQSLVVREFVPPE